MQRINVKYYFSFLEMEQQPINETSSNSASADSDKIVIYDEHIPDTDDSSLVAKYGDTISMRFQCFLENSNVPIIDHMSIVEPSKIIIGDSSVCCGLSAGIINMKVGSIRRIVCPPKVGYGEAGMQPMIPPNATLAFRVQLCGIDQSNDQTS